MEINRRHALSAIAGAHMPCAVSPVERSVSAIVARLEEVGRKRLWVNASHADRLRLAIEPLLDALRAQGHIHSGSFFALSTDTEPFAVVVDIKKPWHHIQGELTPDGFRLWQARKIEWVEDFETGELVRI
jgi:hypothetical protein